LLALVQCHHSLITKVLKINTFIAGRQFITSLALVATDSTTKLQASSSSQMSLIDGCKKCSHIGMLLKDKYLSTLNSNYSKESLKEIKITSPN
jgi:hypothetical protein